MRRPGSSLLGGGATVEPPAAGRRAVPDARRSPGHPDAALALVLAGAALLALAAFLPARTPVGSTLWREGTGWAIVAAAILLAVLALRARGRGTCSWAGLWIGALTLLNALAIAGQNRYG